MMLGPPLPGRCAVAINDYIRENAIAVDPDGLHHQRPRDARGSRVRKNKIQFRNGGLGSWQPGSGGDGARAARKGFGTM